MNRSRMLAWAVTLGLVWCGTTGCLEGRGESSSGTRAASNATIPPGATVNVRLASTVSSETARAGQGWNGVVVSPIVVGDRVLVPEGSPAQGTVVVAKEAERGDRARLELALRSVSVNGRTRKLGASSEPVIAGSTRARNLGAIAGGAAAGALIGKAVGGNGKGAAVGGIVGGAAATGAVAASKGYQVVLKPGMVLTFTVERPIAMN